MSLYLTHDQQKTLENLIAQWKVAVEARDKPISVIATSTEEDEKIPYYQLDDLAFYSDDDEEEELLDEGERPYFSLGTSVKAVSFQVLSQWASRALRATRLLRHGLALKGQLSKEKEQNLLQHLIPPSTEETDDLPTLTAQQISNDTAVNEFVSAVKVKRYQWKKQLASQHRLLKLGFGLIFLKLKYFKKKNIKKSKKNHRK